MNSWRMGSRSERPFVNAIPGSNGLETPSQPTAVIAKPHIRQSSPTLFNLPSPLQRNALTAVKRTRFTRLLYLTTKEDYNFHTLTPNKISSAMLQSKELKQHHFRAKQKKEFTNRSRLTGQPLLSAQTMGVTDPSTLNSRMT